MHGILAHLRTNGAGVILLIFGMYTSIAPWQYFPPLVEPVSAVVEPTHPTVITLLEPMVEYDLEFNTLRSTLSVREPRPTTTPAPTPIPVRVATVQPAVILVKGSGELGWPLLDTRGISTYFSSAHKAIDLDTYCGAVVLASFNGQVVYSGWKSNGGGNVIDIVADNGMVLSYDHLSNMSVVTGDRISSGQQIGAVGATGWAKGCHLHFGVALNGVAVNPLLYL